MATERNAWRLRELEEALECGDQITSDAARILSDCAKTISEYSSKTAPVRDRARIFTHASKNIRQARERCEQILTSLDMSRRLQANFFFAKTDIDFFQGIIRRGPADNMEAFLAAVDQLEVANTVLWSNQGLVCVREATTHSEALRNEAMDACETDYAATLTNGSKMVTREMLAEGVQKGYVELVNANSIPRLKVLGNAMLKGAHQRILKVYTDLRSQLMEQMLIDMGLTPSAFTELQAMSLEHLEEKIKRWVETVSALVVVSKAEKTTADQVFNESAIDGIFSQVIEIVLVRIASFGRDILRTTHGSYKLFSLLEMHQALENVLIHLEPVIAETPSEGRYKDLKALLKEIEDAAGVLFDAFQNSVREDSSKKEVLDGTVHPLTALVLTFFKRLFKHGNFMKVLYGSGASSSEEVSSQFQIGNHMSGTMVRILMDLQDNLEGKSRGYKSKALANFFMMNNVNFIVKSVEQSKAMELLGKPWIERQKTIVHEYTQNYHDITWNPLVKVLDAEASDVVQSNAQKRKTAIKDHFKTFNSTFEEIHTTQMEWIIPDPALKQSVRKTILESLVPAYRRFHETFKNSNFTKNPEKYLKYEAEDVERIVQEDLFENKMKFKEHRRLGL